MTVARLRIGVGALSLSLVLALLLGATGVLAPRGSVAFGASTTLAILGGEVLVSHDGGPFEPAQDGAILGPGDVLRTGDDAHAVLTYFEGSTVTLEPGTEVRIDDASAQPDGGSVVAMTQNLGRTWHVVTRLVSGNSRYEVRTPASTASVRGTMFEVGLEVDAQTGEVVATVAATEGAVATAPTAAPQAPAPEPVVVEAGFETTVRRGVVRADPPRPKAEPERTVTVVLLTGLVLDSQRRANGVTKDGRVVVQTPGARVIQNPDGTRSVVLPDPRDGVISTVIETPTTPQAPRLPDEVRIVTTVAERGKPPVTVEEKIDTRRAETPRIVTGVEVKRGAPNAAPELRQLKEDEKKELKTEKVAEPPKPEPRGPSRPGVGGFGGTSPGTARETARPTERGQKTAEPTDRRTSEPTRPPSDPGRGGAGGTGSTGGQGGGTGQGAGAGDQGEGRPRAPANPPAIIPVLPLQPVPGQRRTDAPRTPIPAPTEKKDDDKKTAEPARGAPVGPPARPAVSSPTSAPANAPARAPANAPASAPANAPASAPASAPGIVPGLPLQPPPAPGQRVAPPAPGQQPAPQAPPAAPPAAPRQREAAPPPPPDKKDDVKREERNDENSNRRNLPRGR